jgi:hypothetical protein
MRRETYVAQVEETARLAREQSGATVVIHEGLMYIGVNWLYNDGETTHDGVPSKGGWFCQGEEAEELLNEVPEECTEEDWILFRLDASGILSGS